MLLSSWNTPINKREEEACLFILAKKAGNNQDKRFFLSNRRKSNCFLLMGLLEVKGHYISWPWSLTKTIVLSSTLEWLRQIYPEDKFKVSVGQWRVLVNT